MSNQLLQYSVSFEGMDNGPRFDKLGYAVQAGVECLRAKDPVMTGFDAVVIWEHRRPHGQLKEVVTQFCVISL